MSHSKPYDYDLPRHMKCWTTCPVRISNYDSVAKQSTLEVLLEWQGHGLPTLSNPEVMLSASRYGHLIANCVPESLIDRLGPLSKMIDLLLLADELTEALDSKNVSTAMDSLNSARSSTPKFDALALIRSHIDQEIMDKDTNLGSAFVDGMTSYWAAQKAFGGERHRFCENFKDYMPFRYCDFASPLIWQMIAFGTGLRPTEGDIESLRVSLIAAATACILWNDIYSWPKEAGEYQQSGVYPTNAIMVLMKEHSINSEEALILCQRMVLQYEMKCRKATDELLNKEDHQLSPSGRALAKSLLLFIGGVALWSCTSDRFQSERMPEYNVLQRVLSAELPYVELDMDFENQFDDVFRGCEDIEKKLLQGVA